MSTSTYDKAAFGEASTFTRSGLTLQTVTLSVPSGPSITLVEKGLHVTSIRFKDVKGEEHDIIIGGDDPAQYVDERKVG
jgi:hypothetical protein